MSVRVKYALPLGAALAFAGFVSLAPAPALAGGYGGSHGGGGGGCCVPPPPCCKPPPSPPPCCGGGHHINIPNVNVNVGATVIVNASATAVGSASANASANGGTTVIGGGGGSSVIFSPGNVGLIGGLNVEGGKKRTAYSAKRTKIKIVVIRAVCIDDREVPHPASQVTPDKEIAEFFEGELFRCVAGARLQISMSDFRSEVSDGAPGETMNCAKGEALYRERAGKLVCRPQTPQRNCFERSLLRRYGAGVKIIKIIVEETYTAYKEESVETASALNMTVDGGVGGIVH
ncbi:MAG TPA: hypothetical protein VF559_01305 [Caulobacteraceae bacterium]|jgi:hypothetical protein